MVVGDMAMLIDLERNVTQLGAVVTPLLIAALDAVHLRVVVPDEAGRGRHVVLGSTNAVVPKIMNMRGKDRLGLILPDQSEQPTSPRLVDVVVALRLSLVADVERIVRQQEQARFRMSGKIGFEPSTLLNLRRMS